MADAAKSLATLMTLLAASRKKRRETIPADTPGLAGPDIQRTRATKCLSDKSGSQKLIVLLFLRIRRDVNATLLPFYGMSIDSLKCETVTAQRIGVVPLVSTVFARATLRSGESPFRPALSTRDSSVWRPARIFEMSPRQRQECRPPSLDRSL